MNLILVTGMSGAGKSVTLQTLEDIGYEVIDNIPLSVLPALVATSKNQVSHLAITMDIRNRDFSLPQIEKTIERLRSADDIQVTVLFLDCDDTVIQRRFTETRRRHPAVADRPVTDGIRQERRAIDALRHVADNIIDTTDFNMADLRNWIRKALLPEGKTSLSIYVTSFSYRRGVPREADLVFDVRFLKNPHYDPKLRDKNGTNRKIAKYIKEDEAFEPFFTRLTEMILPLLPRYEQEGKSYLTIAFGCTGGMHRSVFTAEELTKLLKKHTYDVVLRHREL